MFRSLKAGDLEAGTVRTEASQALRCCSFLRAAFPLPSHGALFISRRFDPSGGNRFRRAVAANMAAPRAVVRRGPDRRSGAFGPTLAQKLGFFEACLRIDRGLWQLQRNQNLISRRQCSRST